MVQTTIRPLEVNIDSIRYKLKGPVLITLPEGFAQKTILGDFTQEGLRRRNTIRWNDLRGGMGLEVVSPQDGQVNLSRCYWSDLHIFDKGHITLGSLATSISGVTGEWTAFETFGGQTYASATNGDVFRTDTADNDWNDTTHDLTNDTVDTTSGNIGGTDYIVFGQDGSGYEFSTDGASYTTGGREAHFLIIWDDRLWGFDVDTNQLFYTLAPSATAGDHTDDAILPAEIGHALGMFVGPDAGNEDIIYVLAVSGLWAHDAANARFVRTPFRFIHPVKRDASEIPILYHIRPVVFLGKIYIPVGMNVFEYSPVEGIIRSIGPADSNNTLPADVISGQIRTLVASDKSIFAFNDLSLSNESAGVMAILEWNRIGWGVLARTGSTSVSANTKNYVALVGLQQKTSTMEYRLWWMHTEAPDFFIDLPRDIASPKKNAAWNYAEAPISAGDESFLVLPWVDAGTDSDSIALRLKIDAQDLDSSNEISVAYRINFSSLLALSGFTNLVSGATALDTSGLNEITFPDNGTSIEGLAFRTIQFRLRLDHDSASNSPDVNSIEFEWFRKATVKLAFEFDIDMKREYADRTPLDQFFTLQNSIKNSTVLLELTWKDTSKTQSSLTRTYYVAITGLQMVEEGTGSSDGGIMRVFAEEI